MHQFLRPASRQADIARPRLGHLQLLSGWASFGAHLMRADISQADIPAHPAESPLTAPSLDREPGRRPTNRTIARTGTCSLVPRPTPTHEAELPLDIATSQVREQRDQHQLLRLPSLKTEASETDTPGRVTHSRSPLLPFLQRRETILPGIDHPKTDILSSPSVRS